VSGTGTVAAVTLAPGLVGTVDHEVTAADTATAVGSGDVAVLGTPCVLALLEKAAVAATEGALREGATTVGTRVELEHRFPTPVGVVVTAEAELREASDRSLVFTVRLLDAGKEAARGTVSRVVVDRARFLAASSRE
jgi:fluoroacetyl-CoA thioesterase